MRHLFRLLLALVLCLGAGVPARAAVTITFWSHEFGNSFPHAFFTLRGVPDAGGAKVDANYGFTARTVSPAILMGTVPGKLDIAPRGYIQGSDAQFSVVMTDAQYASILALIAAWDEKIGDGRYNLNNRNCVHFVAEAARRMGLAGVNQPRLMKRPRSYLQAVEAANVGRVMPVEMRGKAYLASLPPIVATPRPAAVIATATLPPPLP